MKDYKKKYEGLMKNIKHLYESVNPEWKHIIESYIPELKESEDERIRKMIIHVINITPATIAVQYRKEMLDWLEKQVEKKVDKCEGCNNIKGCITCTDGDQYAHITEQKPDDKVEPKFKVGDIVINKKSKDTVKIVQILHDSYCYSGWDGAATVHSDFSISEQDNWELVEQKHNWSEEDERKITGISIVLQSWDSYHVSSADLPSFIPEYISWLKSLKERIKGE